MAKRYKVTHSHIRLIEEGEYYRAVLVRTFLSRVGKHG
jgi:hypothetical protein